MKLSDYVGKHGVSVATVASECGVAASTAYRWIKWCESNGEAGCRPDPDQIVKLQGITGGAVTVFDWQTPKAPADAVPAPADEPSAA